MSRLVAIACLAFATCVTATLTPSTVLNINSGDVQGIFNSKSNITWFKGIPYAAPPIGDLRFAPTKPEAPWTGVLNASEYGPGCISYCPPVGFPKRELMCAAKQSEDCLYLNVFTPALSSSSEPTPVVVFIHGGNFEYGAGGVPLYDGQQLAMTQNVVVVTINYRLNVFGALYTGAGKIEGNFMLMDQIRALEWVQNNIAYFGGDPDRVTISGQSAGAFSTASLVTMPAAAGLFDKAIIISNPFTLLAADPAGAMQLGMKASDALGCGSSGSVEEIKCLRSVTAAQILNVSKTNYNFNPNALLNVMMQWVPVVDGDLLPMQPLDAYERGAFTKVPIFYGTVANESVEFIWELSPAPLSVDGLALLAGTIFGPNLTQIIDLYGWPPKSQDADTRDFLSVIATDFIFYCVNRYVGRAMSKHTLTFMWYFDYASYLNPWIFNKTMPECVTNVCHAQDLEFIFFPIDWIAPEKGEPLPVPDSERRLAKLVQDSWGHFIHTGSPDPVGAGLGPDVVSPGTQYPQFNGTQNLLVNISLPTSMLHGYRNDYCDFWDKMGYRKRR